MRLHVALLATAAIACNGATPTPSPVETAPALGNVFMVPWSQEHFGNIVVNVRDQTGLVVGARKLQQAGPGGARPESVADARPDDRQIDVEWLGGVCRFGPTVTVTGDAQTLLVTIDPTAGGQLPPGIGCSDIGAFYGVTLDLNTPIEQQAIEVEALQ